MELFNRLYSGAKDILPDRITGRTESMRGDYVKEFYSKKGSDSYSGCFEKGLDAVTVLRAAKKYNNGKYMDLAMSKILAIESNPVCEDAGYLAVNIWVNTEAYQATGHEAYILKSKYCADSLIGDMMDVGRFVKSGKYMMESDAETQLLSASALLQLYELSKMDEYRKRAEGILDFFMERHVSGSGEIAGKLDVSVQDGAMKYNQSGGDKRLSELAAMAYMNAYRVLGNYSNEAKRFIGLSEGSLMVLSEANKSFKMNGYSGKYRDMLKLELLSRRHSLYNLAGVLGRPVFDVEPDDPSLLRDMLGTNFSIALGAGLIWTTVVSFGVPVYAFSTAATSAAGALVSPYIGRLADRIGKKTMLAMGLSAYTLSTMLMPWSIGWAGNNALIVLQTSRGVSAIAAGPMISSLVTDAVPASKRTEALSQSTAAYNWGYTAGALTGGMLTESLKAGSGLMKLSPFLVAAFPPALMAARMLSNYKRAKEKRQELELIFRQPKESA